MTGFQVRFPMASDGRYLPVLRGTMGRSPRRSVGKWRAIVLAPDARSRISSATAITAFPFSGCTLLLLRVEAPCRAYPKQTNITAHTI